MSRGITSESKRCSKRICSSDTMGQRLRFGAKIFRLPKDAEGKAILIISSMGIHLLTDYDFGYNHVDALLVASTTDRMEYLEPEDMLEGLREVEEVKFQ